MNILDWMGQHISVFLDIALILAGAMVINRFGAHIITRILQRTMREDAFPSKTDRDRRVRTLTSIFTALLGFVIWASAILMLMGRVGINTAPLLASAGIVGVAIGFGAQSLVRDFVTGIFIIAENQYRVGDYVEIQNVRGTVRSVSMRTTVLQDDEGSIFHIPNGSIVVTGNHTMNNSKVAIELSASTDTDIEKLRKIVNETGKELAETAPYKEMTTEPFSFSRVKEIKGGLVIVRMSGRVHAGKQIEVKSAFYEALQKELVKNKIALK